MKETLFQRLHLDMHGHQAGIFTGWDPDTHKPTCFDLANEIKSDKGKAEPREILARHLTNGGTVSTDAFAHFGREPKIKTSEWAELEARREAMKWPAINRARVLKAKWSLGTPNRSNIIAPNNEWKLDTFNDSNPIGPYAHRTSFSGPESIVAKWLLATHERKTDKSDLIGFPEFVSHETNPASSTVLGLYQEGALNGVSPGFLVGEVEFSDSDDSIVFRDLELIEISFVPVPRHAGAVIMAVNSGAVELQPLRDLVQQQLEVCYSDPVRIVEFARLEQVAKKLGLDSGQVLFDMSTEDLEKLELPGSSATQDVQLMVLRARALREGPDAGLARAELAEEFSELGEDLAPWHRDSESWERFCVVELEGEPDDKMIILAARCAGLGIEADALEAVAQLEASSALPESKNGNKGETEPEENSQDDEEPETDQATAEAFSASLANIFDPIKTEIENRTGRVSL